MKSREARDAMLARVQAAFEKWPKFEDMPTVKVKGDARAKVSRAVNEFGALVITQESYVQALYACAHDDAEPIGRQGDFVVGKAVD